MKCAICRNGETEEGKTTIVLERDDTTLVFKNVPVQVCVNCGEQYVSPEINHDLLSRAGDAVSRGVDFEMLRFAA